VKNGSVKFREEYWEKISPNAKEFVKKLLTYSEKDRPPAQDALSNPWIANWSQAPETKFDVKHLDSLKDFAAQNKLKRAALQIIARRLTEKDVTELKDAFMSLDKNKDGVVTYAELQDGVKKLNTPGIAELLQSLQGMLNTLDSNGTATLDYSEFLAATLNCRTYQEDQVLWAAFHVFDKDQSGEISRKELIEVLKDDEVKDFVGASCIDQVLKECDTSGDGNISFDEFKKMMLSSTPSAQAAPAAAAPEAETKPPESTAGADPTAAEPPKA